MLVKVYESYVRPTVEYCSVVYGPMLNKTEKTKLENLQRNALRIIYGHKKSYEYLLKTSGLETLEKRRHEALKKFALKTLNNKRFAERWFPQNDKRCLRRTEKYEIRKSSFDRYKNSPLNEMRQILNSTCDNPSERN